ncbi:dimethyl sulfoxide reductase anchor subunit (plasmid) [Rhizobium sp. CC1099]|uniref:dimethyl sulfoxide reductase anchor subunit family protein n=1 Tax=Rhizobium sp. CC1099 TaxID=3039160 RepID=UPI0024B23E8C|nr:DmsC/YnfH family molybdoenzyme membrane anchor subunit [Rhizobium sp. CC1099]WFU91398.1 dimethyl sulfoxide reductase anchor subunit [Rhizobium sp. CC1099]
MNPASSVLLLTTLTGFGYGLLAWLGLLVAFDLIPPSPLFLPAAVVVALAFSSAGLIASTLHLGRPERAWRAFSQWRSSWLSREGVASLSTYPPALGLAVSWWHLGPNDLLTQALGLFSAFLALTTVGCTAMIYASLKPIRQWHNAHTVPDYLIYAMFSGAVLLSSLWSFWFGFSLMLAGAAIASAIIAIVAKVAYWRFIDRQQPLATLASATGLSSLGSVRPLDNPHFTENYILREMGYQVARKHAARLRRIALALAFLVPVLLTCLAASSVIPTVTAGMAALLALVGLFVERWLFFAEATHVSTIYYGR